MPSYGIETNTISVEPNVDTLYSIYRVNRYTSNWTSIENDFYFSKLFSNFPQNENGSCGYVSMSMLLGYHDIFYNDDLVNDEYTVSSYDIQTKIEDWNESPGTQIDFQTHLINNYGIDCDGQPWTNSLTMNAIEQISNEYIEEQIGLEYNDVISVSGHNKIKNAISNNHPVLIGAYYWEADVYQDQDIYNFDYNPGSHAMVVYGYYTDNQGNTFYRAHLSYKNSSDGLERTDVVVKINDESEPQGVYFDLDEVGNTNKSHYCYGDTSQFVIMCIDNSNTRLINVNNQYNETLTNQGTLFIVLNDSILTCHHKMVLMSNTPLIAIINNDIYTLTSIQINNGYYYNYYVDIYMDSTKDNIVAIKSINGSQDSICIEIDNGEYISGYNIDQSILVYSFYDVSIEEEIFTTAIFSLINFDPITGIETFDIYFEFLAYENSTYFYITDFPCVLVIGETYSTIENGLVFFTFATLHNYEYSESVNAFVTVLNNVMIEVSSAQFCAFIPEYSYGNFI
jgi:hypothetical protein